MNIHDVRYDTLMYLHTNFQNELEEVKEGIKKQANEGQFYFLYVGQHRIFIADYFAQEQYDVTVNNNSVLIRWCHPDIEFESSYLKNGQD